MSVLKESLDNKVNKHKNLMKFLCDCTNTSLIRPINVNLELVFHYQELFDASPEG